MRYRNLARMSLLTLMATATLGPLNARAAEEPTCPESGTVRFGVEPYDAPNILLPAYRQIGQLLGEKLGCDVEIQITSSYTAEIEAMRHGQLDVGEFGPFGTVLAQKVAGAKVVAQFGDSDGEPRTYWASIVTWKDSGVDSLEDVRGKTFAYSDPASTSGHLMPAYALKRAGIDPKEGVTAMYAGTHTNSFEALRNHKVQVGELNAETKSLAKEKGWWEETDFKTLWKSDPLPLDGIAISPELDPALQKRITEILQGLQFDQVLNEEQKGVMNKKAQLIPATSETYAYIEDVMDKMDITMEDL